jgi:molecular chaperone DnaK
MTYPIGIDLGTTNSTVCVRRRGILEVIPVEGRSVLPSVVSIRPDGVVLVGNAAKARTLAEPSNSVTSAKRFIGDASTQWDIDGRVFTPIDVSALILERLKEAAEEYLATPVSEAVITVPAYFNNNQKAATKAAAEQAGLRVLQLLPEPTAGAISYGLDKDRDQLILVYDLGGGTFDVSILSVEQNRFSVVAVDGDFSLGGDDFDIALVDYLIDKLQESSEQDMGVLRRLFRRRQKQKKEVSVDRELLVARQRLKEVAEKAKKELAEAKTAQVILPNILGCMLDIQIDIGTYNRLIEPLVVRTMDKINDVLQAADLTRDDIDRVILIGGSTRNLLVKERVAAEVKEPYISEFVDEDVARGAAIVADYLCLPDQDLLPIEFTNVTPFSLGVRASLDGNVDLFQALIPKNNSVPASVSQVFTTYRANQRSVDVAVFQGENPQCRDNIFIGGFQLEGIPRAPAGDPKVVVNFDLDSSDLLKVSASCSHLHSEKTLDVSLVSREEDMTPATPEADIIFLIDTSGSMSTELEGVKRSCLDFAQRIMDGGVSCRLGLVDFDKGCSGEPYRWEIFGPMESTLFPNAISCLRIGRLGGCGCYIGEMDTLKVVDSFVKSFPGEGRLSIGILISDEVGNDRRAVDATLERLQRGQICLHVVGVKGSCHERLATETGGRFWDINASRGRVDFSNLLDAVAVEITHLALK